MAFDRLEYVRVESEFLRLGGGDLWDTIENAAWQWRELYLAQQRDEQKERQRFKLATPSGRAKHNAYKRALYYRSCERVVAARGCAHCGKIFPVSKAQKARGSDRTCSLSCAAKARTARRGVPPLNSVSPSVTIGGVTRTRREWAEHYGISLVSLHYRMTVKGMSLIEALTTPKMPGRGPKPRRKQAA